MVLTLHAVYLKATNFNRCVHILVNLSSIASNDRESELVISAFDNNDVGTYHCIAANSVGSDTALVRLDLCPPESLPCPVNATEVFNLPVEFTEGLNDTCVYCATWQMTDYGPCDPPCHLGFKKRYVRCETFFDPRHLIEDQLCSQVQMKPEEESDCKADFAQSPPENRACRLTPQWKTWPWSMCSETCQGGKQTRNVKCVVPRTGAPMPDSACPARPITERPCNEGVVCGCIDVYSACKYVDGNMCQVKQIREKCCATCTAGRFNTYH